MSPPDADTTASAARSRRDGARPRVLIVGGGVAGLETLLALRALAGDAVDITLLGRDAAFVNHSMSVDQPFRPRRARGIRLETVARELGAHWHQATLDRVVADRHRAITREGVALPYDRLVLAVGARPERGADAPGVLTYHGGEDGPAFRQLLRRIDARRGSTVAFVKHDGTGWPLPLYDLALMTAADCLARGRTDIELSLITTEDAPLEVFGHAASVGVRELVEERGIRLHTGSYATPSRPGWLRVSPGERSMRVDHVVTQPRLAGPLLRGVPCDSDGFIRTDAHGRVEGLDDVFAAGDATTFPVKQGGLAAQQADAVAESIAASVGADVEPSPFRPILRGVLLTGTTPRYLRADISGGAGENSTVSEEPLWHPPVKLGGRWLSGYLASQIGDAADVMPGGRSSPGELADLVLSPLARA
jgi:sulfide:quinone oxidoreductase